ncbi:MAG: hypothetical protein C0498_01515 [Anaerolinea sp.]|nr:hypothetical protein [Anaerolinea sp.]
MIARLIGLHDRLRHGKPHWVAYGVGGARRVYGDGFERRFTPPPPAPRYQCVRCAHRLNTSPDELCYRCAGDDRLTTRQQTYLAAAERLDLPAYPHCDPNVLHAPVTCEVCALGGVRRLHALRAQYKIRYTGEQEPAAWDACPSEAYRPVALIESWSGNRARR